MSTRRLPLKKSNMQTKFVFWGSFRVSRDILAGMIKNGQVPVAVVCTNDKPTGKKQVITPPAVKAYLLEQKLPIEIIQTENPKEIAEKLKSLAADFFVVMGYPRILPTEIINLPPKGTLGVHPSLLPKYRGASPIQSALLSGETQTGVSLYAMNEKMDHGPLIATAAISIEPDETNESLEQRLAQVAADLLKKTLPDFVAGKTQLVNQDHAQATFTRKFTTKDAEIDIQKDQPEVIYRKIQAFTPEPGVYTFSFPGHEGKRVKLLAASFADGRIQITKIQVEGKKPIELTQ